jgi:hypothetical protein
MPCADNKQMPAQGGHPCCTNDPPVNAGKIDSGLVPTSATDILKIVGWVSPMIAGLRWAYVLIRLKCWMGSPAPAKPNAICALTQPTTYAGGRTQNQAH